MAAGPFLKRIIDVGACVTALPVAVPLCMILLVLIRIDSPGPGLFVQRRVGRDGASFRMFKLRTMGAQTGDMPSHHVEVTQITRLGRWLRRLKLDELPQLLNVLGGSMSLVGPRPCLPIQTELIEERRARDLLRYRPGITGPAQIRGVDMSEPARLATVEADYFHHSTIATDLMLILSTVLGGGIADAALKRAEH